jgi:predicted CoA-binding protein
MDWKSNIVQDIERVGSILRGAKTVAVVGIKESRFEPAFFVPEYLQRHGYRIIPVNPKYKTVLGEVCVSSLRDIGDPVDIVEVFRASHNIMPHAHEALELRPAVFWMQDGIAHAEAAQMLAEAGILVVQNRCMLRDHSDLIVAGGA